MTEVASLLATRLGPGPEVRFLGDLASGALTVEPVAAAERLRVTEIATLDRRHFGVVRPRHAEAFALLR